MPSLWHRPRNDGAEAGGDPSEAGSDRARVWVFSGMRVLSGMRIFSGMTVTTPAGRDAADRIRGPGCSGRRPGERRQDVGHARACAQISAMRGRARGSA